MNRIFSVLFFAAFLSAAAFAQNPIPTPPKTDGDVVKISTSLIQIDATVTDKDGNIIDGEVVDFDNHFCDSSRYASYQFGKLAGWEIF